MKTMRIVTLTVTCISLFLMILLLTADASFAERRGRRYTAPRHTRHERVIAREHFRQVPRWSAKKNLHFKRGAHYRPFWRSNYPARARVLHRLPFGYRTVWVGSSAYFLFNGMLYERVPSGYVVINSPPETVVIKKTSTVVQPFESASGNAVVTVSTLNVRTGPGLDYALISQVPEGGILEVHGKADGWLYIRLTDGQFGWVKSVFTEKLDPASG